MNQKIKDYISTVLSWNQKINLTSYKTSPEFLEKLVKPSITLINKLNPAENSTLIDIGTGAGIPGIPISIIRPDLNITLVESVRKKSDFLVRIKEELGLNSIRILNERAEVLVQSPELRERFTYACSRSLAKLGPSLELLAPFTIINGWVIIFTAKSERDKLLEPEIKLELGLEKLNEWNDIFEGIVLVMKKISSTKKEYPRRWNVIKNKPKFVKRK